jgi:uncharacterized protein (UPF0548 family)
MFYASRPTAREIERFLSESLDLPLSYGPIGLARAGHGEAGFDVDEEVSVVGVGDAVFDSARRALVEWRHFDLGWTELFPERAPISPDTVVAVLVRHLGLWSLNGCRIVYGIGAAGDRDFGFAYGTLANHAESGEEIFRVRLDPDTGEVSYVIRAVSKPRAALAKLGYPFVRRLQARFRRDSAAAVRKAVG